MNVHAVIGAGFGDEGKGHVTDFLASNYKNPIVVRYNSGAQAGHTVQLSNGTKHIFGHFGSGTLAYAPTYLSKHYVVNPSLFAIEEEKVTKLISHYKMFVHKDCLITTPYDMLINQIRQCGHGTCGVGFNETITRSLPESKEFKNPFPELKLTISDLVSYGEEFLIEKLKAIRSVYLPYRLQDLKNISIDYLKLIVNNTLFNNYIEDLKHFINSVIICDDEILNNYENVIFEGAQGLILSEDHRYYPYVTRSQTGLTNIVQILYPFADKIEYIDVNYITRTYVTRHGDGPLPDEIHHMPYKRVKDTTNVNNPFQGHLRYAYLNLKTLGTEIQNDYDKLYIKKFHDIFLRRNLFVNCFDQIDSVGVSMIDRMIR